ncbi:MAG TPA: SDR family oxidoreductase [Gaiellales bacterium]|jgi:NAD(P)-dependent dehydrogenase (short-subunit alcohol dehydrogenase family)
MSRLAGKAALVTGGTSGLGAQMVRRFAAEGAAVVFTGRDAERGAAVAREPRATFVAADVRSDTDTERAVATAVETLGGLDVLVCNAGTGLVSPLIDTPPDELSRILDVNVTGCLRYARACLPHLERRGGSMIHIASDAGVIGEDPIGAYSVSKAAVVMLGKMLAVDCGRRGVRSNVLCPGDIAPGMREMRAPGEAERADEPSSWPVPPIGRIGDSADVASAAVFLASDDAAFVNGAVILVDGGMRAAMRAADFRL